MSEVSIIIPNYNGEVYLYDCLDALKKQTFTDFDVIMVDNASTDDSVDKALLYYPGIKVICLMENTGFAKAVNEGIKASTSEYVILLNNDTIVLPNFVGNHLKMIRNKPEVFSCSAMMVQNAHRELIDDAGDEFSVLGWGFAPDRDKKVTSCMVPHEIFSSCAGAAIYRRDVFDKIGYFDEYFFAYLEDMDLGYRSKLAGYKNIYNPYAKVYHIGSASSGSRHNAFKVKLSARNSMYLIRKNMPKWQHVLNSPFIFIGMVIKALYFARKGLGKDYLKGIFSGYVDKVDINENKYSIKRYMDIQMWLVRGTIKRFQNR